MKIALAALLALTPVAALADDYQPGYSTSKTCYKTEYREEYVPGTEDNPGYVKSWKETIEFPCQRHTSSTHRHSNPPQQRTITEEYNEYDTNDCSDGSVIGGLLGGGLAGFGSRGKDRWWAIPTGIVGGSMIGCQIDGG